MCALKLESYVRKVTQPRGGFLSLRDLNQRTYGGELLVLESDFSPMLLSTIIQQIVAYGACGREAVVDPLSKKIASRLSTLDKHQQEQELAILNDDLVLLENADEIDGAFIRGLCRLLSYSPQISGGIRKFPDGGYVEPTSDDVKLIWQLARRAYSFLYEDRPDKVEFKVEYEADGYEFSSAVVDFLTPDAAYKITPSNNTPQTRDTLLAFMWAYLARVDRFGIYNPMTDVMYWGRVSDLSRDDRNVILSNFLND